MMEYANELRKKRITAFFFTYVTFFSYHMMRAAYSYIKLDLVLITAQAFSKTQIGALDMTFFILYGIGLFISGFLGDKISKRIILFIGSIGCGITFIIFGLFGYFQLTNYYLYLVVLGLNGFFQSSGFTSCISILGKWWNKNKRGFVMGIWGTCDNTGNFSGFLLTAYIFAEWYPDTFLIAGICLIFGILSYIFILASPEDMNGTPIFKNQVAKAIKEEGKTGDSFGEGGDGGDIGEEMQMSKDGESSNEPNSAKIKEKKQKATILQVLQISGIFSYSLTFGCLKTINYFILFWVPLLMDESLYSRESIILALFFNEFGQIVGKACFGYVSDKFGFRVLLFIPCMIGSFFAFSLIWLSFQLHLPTIALAIFLFINQIFFAGPYFSIPSAIAQDLAEEHYKLTRVSVHGSATGYVSGFGTIIMAFSQFGIGFLHDQIGDYIIFILSFMTFLTLLLSIKLLRKQYLIYKQTKSSKNSDEVKPTPQKDEVYL